MRRAMTISKARSPSWSGGGSRVFRRCFMQAVEAVATPVEFFLQRDHPCARRLSFSAGGVERSRAVGTALIADGSREIGRKAAALRRSRSPASSTGCSATGEIFQAQLPLNS